MHLSALLVAAAVAAAPVENPPAAPSRGVVTWIGVGLLGVGLGAAGFGVGGLLQNADAVRLLNAYPKEVPMTESAAYSKVLARSVAGLELAKNAFIVGGIALVGSIACLVLDTPSLWVKVAFAPERGGGGTFVFSAQF